MYFLDFRYTFSKKEAFKPEELKRLGAKREIKAIGEVTLETEYNKLKKVIYNSSSWISINSLFH
jgi:hypothetical protein